MSRSSPCLWTPLPQAEASPCDRYKHACCTYQGDVYVLGGRSTHCLRDFWSYSVVRNEWTQLPCKGEAAPEELEEHSMVAHEGFLYAFGGTLDGAYTGCGCPLWVFDLGKNKWVHWQGKKTVCRIPTNRKSHSAVVFGSSMFVYGGYVDMRGSSQEFWRLDFDSMCWSLLGGDQQSGPGPRHSHCAVAHQETMYLYGGLRGLREQRDFWSWNSGSRSWCCLKTTSGPSRLVGHTAVAYRDGLLLYGGGQSLNSPLNSLWRYSFRSQSWERLALLLGSTSPPARIHHCCLGLGPSYQPTTSRGSPLPRVEAKPRPFKNKCFPSPLSYLGTQPEGAIELETFERTENGLTMRCPVGEGKQNCLTFENQAFCNRWSCEDMDENCEREDLEEMMKDVIVQNLPDLLLLLGGKPLGQQAALSVWQMTLTEP
ncbi:leucine-zipper-like transcriptional regulator 1 homolog isoform X1 [Gadus macrocephalus]|uniref:leucine-zipper-like transcriptional regulator 1 homolog isoform X1 n=2 Tax=Gadus macrocephalus TaxID=80720 RepID=UPI0028CBA980|nr:leucine-zipper-like transcriptional regulator 1 homolog isoform X1 [Gadus macrocephalus]XP_059896866.1 leucine-zipper-like transcriptional regulator 1 homolog isoform X1 [Gadus macrocephalus]